jgi:hypothetical protein
MPGRSLDRYHITIRRQLAGQDHRNDGGGSDIDGVVIVFCRFDNECHVQITVRTPIAYRKPCSKLKRLNWFGASAARANSPRRNATIYGENNTANKRLLTLRECHHTHIG